MKYKDLIEKLQPFAEQEIHMTASHIDYDGVTTVEARFFESSGDGELIVAAKQKYNSETFDNIGETEVGVF